MATRTSLLTIESYLVSCVEETVDHDLLCLGFEPGEIQRAETLGYLVRVEVDATQPTYRIDLLALRRAGHQRRF